ncbi:MAG: DNA polymerase I [Marinilabiliales bacterium]|nr:MAG: DNA polymerase I [Marinilabiliales bacterium]
MSQKKLFLLDAYALIYRAYFAFIRNPIINSKGLNTSAVFGFVNTLDEVLREYSPSHIAVAFDPPSPTFRHKEYKEYKANREAMPEDIKKSIPYIKDIIKAYNIPIVQVDGYEADDVIGTLAKKAEQEYFEVVMMTPDKDYCQLVSENIKLLKPRRSGKDAELWGIKEVQEKFMVDTPEQVIDVLGLMGDSSDNIPGAMGIGEKTAKKLISQYKSIQNLYENLDDLKGKQKEKIETQKEQVELSRYLVTIALDVPVELNEKELVIRQPDLDALKSIFSELEFNTMLQKLSVYEKVTQTRPSNVDVTQGSLFDFGGEGELVPTQSYLQSIDDVEHNYQLVDDAEKRASLLARLQEKKEFCFDTETTSINAHNAELVGISFSVKKGEAFYIPFTENKDSVVDILKELEPVFVGKAVKIGQNLKYDITVLNNYGIEVHPPYFDTMIAHYLVEPEQRHNMDALAEKYLQYKPVSIETLIGKKGKNQLSMRTVDQEKICAYACEDADVTFQLKYILDKELDKEKLKDLFHSVEMPLLRVLTDMEIAGVNLDSDFLIEYGTVLREELISIEKNIFHHAGIEFNIASPKQLGEVLFDRLKIDPKAKKTKTKQYSTNEEVLQRLAGKHPVINDILDFRSLKKLLSTYVEALPKLVNEKTNRIHTSFNQARVATGRLSSDNPNLQNIPIREERGREIRKAFIPYSEEYVFFSADYSQVELRLMAHMSKDENMIKAFSNNEDIHAATASKIYNVPLEQVTREMRSAAKTANFGIIYGISAFGLSQRLNIKRTDAKDLIDSYFNSYFNVKEYMDECIRKARDRGYVETLFGRKRWLKDINSRNATVRGLAERNAINAPIQGSAADIIKMAMIKIHQKLEKENLKSVMVMQVHDELNFNALKSELEIVSDIVKSEMENAVEISVPLLVEMGYGKNWLEAH